ncbi:hypothetical protein Dimus_035318, partial [Dionaea muscipula]
HVATRDSDTRRLEDVPTTTCRLRKDRSLPADQVWPAVGGCPPTIHGSGGLRATSERPRLGLRAAGGSPRPVPRAASRRIAITEGLQAVDPCGRRRRRGGGGPCGRWRRHAASEHPAGRRCAARKPCGRLQFSLCGQPNLFEMEACGRPRGLTRPWRMACDRRGVRAVDVERGREVSFVPGLAAEDHRAAVGASRGRAP